MVRNQVHARGAHGVVRAVEYNRASEPADRLPDKLVGYQALHRAAGLSHPVLIRLQNRPPGIRAAPAVAHPPGRHIQRPVRRDGER